MSYTNPRQITKYQTNKNLLEVNDRLQLAEASNASNIHSRYSKINLVGLDYSKGKGDNTVVVDLNVDPDTMKFIADAVLRGEKLNFSEQKILPSNKNKDGLYKVTGLNIKYNDKMRYCWNVLMENGLGEIQKNEKTGGLALKKGSYKKEKEVKIFISDIDFKKMMLTVLDYIRNFEITNFRTLMQQREEFETKQKVKSA